MPTMKRKRTDKPQLDVFEQNRRIYEGIAEFLAFMANAGALLGRGDHWLAFDVATARRATDLEDPWNVFMDSDLQTRPGLDIWGRMKTFGATCSDGDYAFVHIDNIDEPAENYPYLAEIRTVLDGIPRLAGEQLEQLTAKRDRLMDDMGQVFAEHREEILDALFRGHASKPSGPTKH